MWGIASADRNIKSIFYQIVIFFLDDLFVYYSCFIIFLEYSGHSAKQKLGNVYTKWFSHRLITISGYEINLPRCLPCSSVWVIFIKSALMCYTPSRSGDGWYHGTWRRKNDKGSLENDKLRGKGYQYCVMTRDMKFSIDEHILICNVYTWI